MTTGDLVNQLRAIWNYLAAAEVALQAGDLTKFNLEYAQALRAIDAFEDLKAAANL